MSRRMKITLIAVAVAAVIAVTAVGLAMVADDRPTRAEYRTAVASARNRTDATLERITKAQSREELIDRMDDAAIVIDHAADDLDETGGVDRFEQTNERLVAALHALSTDLEGTAAQLRQPEFGDLLDGTRGLSFDTWTRVNAQLAALRADGIAVRPLARH